MPPARAICWCRCLAGGQVKRPGLLPSTRTPGLAVLTDIAPTLLDYLRADSAADGGRPLSRGRTSGARAHCPESHSRRVDDYARPLTRRLVDPGGARRVFPAGVGSPHTRARRGARGGTAAGGAAGGAVAVGTWAPATPPLVPGRCFCDSRAGRVAVALGRWPATGPPLAGRGRPVRHDTLTGSRLLQASPIGYSPYAGLLLRIGNEGSGYYSRRAGLVLITSRRPARGGQRRAEGRGGAFGARCCRWRWRCSSGTLVGGQRGGGLSAA